MTGQEWLYLIGGSILSWIISFYALKLFYHVMNSQDEKGERTKTQYPGWIFVVGAIPFVNIALLVIGNIKCCWQELGDKTKSLQDKIFGFKTYTKEELAERKRSKTISEVLGKL